MTPVPTPRAFPRDRAGLDEWAVYGDYLQTIGDPRGELIATDLALPDLATREQVAAFHRAHAQLLPRRYSGVELGFALGHVRTVEIFTVLRSRVESAQHARVRSLLAEPGAHLIDRVAFALDLRKRERDRAWRGVLSLVPDGARVVIAPNAALEREHIAWLLAELPPHVRDLAVVEARHTAFALIDDRFDVVELRDRMAWASVPEPILERLSATSRVRVRVDRVAATWPERVELGRPGDAALYDPARHVAVALRRHELAQIQRQAGVVGIRAQIASRLPEAHGDGLVRRGDRWTARTPTGAIVELATGDPVAADGTTWRFYADAAAARALF